MKALKILFFSVSAIGFFSCDNNEIEDFNAISVDRYIDLLKAGNYSSYELPIFMHEDIPALLEYRNETQTITDFPVNGISSLSLPERALGMYVLWTIESIRAVATDSEKLIGRFPSQNPIVETSEEPFTLEDGSEVHEIVSQAYFDWWENNKQKDFNDFKSLDPLMQTGYRWH